MDKLPSQVCYVCMVPNVSLKMIQDDRIWQCYVQCGMMLWHLLTSFFALFLLLKSFILSFFSMATFAQCTNQDSNCVYAGTNLWHNIWYQYDMVCMLWEVWSLMCTSNVAGNTQMASLNRQVTQNGLGVSNAMAREYTMVSSRLPSVAMMSGGVLDVDTKMMETRP